MNGRGTVVECHARPLLEGNGCEGREGGEMKGREGWKEGERKGWKGAGKEEWKGNCCIGSCEVAA